MRKSFFTLMLALCALVVSACASSQEFIVVDQREVLGEVFTEQTGNIDNSNSSVDLSQDIAARRQFRHSVDIQLNANSRVDRRNVEERIYETYELPSAQGEKLCIIPADVPAGRIYQYDIEWTQVLREGNIEEGTTPGQGNLLGTYKIIVDLQCQVVGVSQK